MCHLVAKFISIVLFYFEIQVRFLSFPIRCYNWATQGTRFGLEYHIWCRFYKYTNDCWRILREYFIIDLRLCSFLINNWLSNQWLLARNQPTKSTVIINTSKNIAEGRPLQLTMLGRARNFYRNTWLRISIHDFLQYSHHQLPVQSEKHFRQSAKISSINAFHSHSAGITLIRYFMALIFRLLFRYHYCTFRWLHHLSRHSSEWIWTFLGKKNFKTKKTEIIVAIYR